MGRVGRGMEPPIKGCLRPNLSLNLAPNPLPNRLTLNLNLILLLILIFLAMSPVSFVGKASKNESKIRNKSMTMKMIKIRRSIKTTQGEYHGTDL